MLLMMHSIWNLNISLPKLHSRLHHLKRCSSFWRERHFHIQISFRNTTLYFNSLSTLLAPLLFTSASHHASNCEFGLEKQWRESKFRREGQLTLHRSQYTVNKRVKYESSRMGQVFGRLFAPRWGPLLFYGKRRKIKEEIYHPPHIARTWSKCCV